VIVKEIEKQGIPVAHITAMTMVSRQIGANRVVTGTKIPHPCGDPNLSSVDDQALRREIVECALGALETEVDESTVFVPDVSFTSG
jgi:glycine reductase complex component B subunit gamma